MNELRKLYYVSYQKWLDYWVNGLGINVVKAEDIMVYNKAVIDRANLILRHDIDKFKPEKIIKTAEIEESFGIRGSYYILIEKRFYYKKEGCREFFLELQDRGHEIGLHVNSASVSRLAHRRVTWREEEDALKRLDEDIVRFKEDFRLNTMCAHGSPFFEGYNNVKLMRDYNNIHPVSFQKFFKGQNADINDSSNVMSIKTGRELIPRIDGENDLSKIKNGDIMYFVNHPQLYHGVGDDLLYTDQERGGKPYAFMDRYIYLEK